MKDHFEVDGSPALDLDDINAERNVQNMQLVGLLLRVEISQGWEWNGKSRNIKSPGKTSRADSKVIRHFSQTVPEDLSELTCFFGEERDFSLDIAGRHGWPCQDPTIPGVCLGARGAIKLEQKFWRGNHRTSRNWVVKINVMMVRVLSLVAPRSSKYIPWCTDH